MLLIANDDCPALDGRDTRSYIMCVCVRVMLRSKRRGGGEGLGRGSGARMFSSLTHSCYRLPFFFYIFPMHGKADKGLFYNWNFENFQVSKDTDSFYYLAIKNNIIHSKPDFRKPLSDAGQ